MDNGITDATLIGELQDLSYQHIKGKIGIVYFNEDADDLFGMDILYQQGLDDLSGDPQYNGNISGIKW